MRRFACVGVLAVLLSASCCAAAGAASLEPVGIFERPIFVSSDPGDPNRLLVVERRGRVVEVGPSGARTLADLRTLSLVRCCEGEQGLLSIAPAPDFGDSGRFYAAYVGTAAAGQVGDLHVDSFRPDPQLSGGLIREPMLSIGHAQHDNHYGGQLQLGPDGLLYISTGDGGGGGDPLGSGQDTEALLGKVLRIDPRPGQEPPYAIPAGNPFAGVPGRDEIWAYGLRNPWRFSFDRESGDMAIGDVGQEAREEIDYAASPAAGVVGGGGANYGWNCREGLDPYPPGGCAMGGGFTDPVFDYPHDDPGGGAAHGCSIIGGYVVRDASLGDLYGRYVYSDYCSGEIRSLLLPAAGGPATGDRSEGMTVVEPTSFGEDACGRLYVISVDGPVYRLVGASPPVGCPEVASKETMPSPSPPANPFPRSLPRPSLALSSSGRLPRVRIITRLSPCSSGDAGRMLRLKRGGRRFAAKPLDDRCIANFRAHVIRRSTFKAVLSFTADSTPLRSSRLLVVPGAARRVQP